MTKHSRTSAVVALVVSAALTLAGCSKNEEEQQQAQETSSTTTAAPSTRSEQNREEDVTPGARIGVDQRTWPDPAGAFDDSAHTTPGQWSVDYLYQRPVWTPVDFEGDFPDKSALVNGGFEQCSTGNTELGGITQQYVYGRYLPVSEQSGPTRMDNGVPAGYAHSPQGAVLFALALMSYGKPDAGDEVGFAIDDAWWSTYERLQDTQAGYTSRQGLASARADMVPPPGFYRVVDCSESVAVVEVGIDLTGTGGDALTTTLPLYWRDGDWEVDLTGPAGKRFDSPGSFNPENAEPLKVVRYE